MIVNTKKVNLNTIEDKHYSKIFVEYSVMSEKLGEFVKRIRDEKGLTVADVHLNSKKSGKSISTSYINKIENEPNVNPSYPKIQALAKGLGVTEAEIVSRISGKKPNQESVIDEQFENLSLKFSGLPPSKKERAKALIELMDRELERLANEKQ